MNDPENKIVVLNFTGIVEVIFALNPAYVSFSRIVKKDLGRVKFVKIIGKDLKKYHVTKVKSESKFIEANYIAPTKKNPEPRISVKFVKLPPVGPFGCRILISSNHPKVKQLVLTINAYVLGKILVKPEEIIFAVSPQQPHPVKIVYLSSSEKKNFEVVKSEIVLNSFPNRKSNNRYKIIIPKKDDLEIKYGKMDKNGRIKLTIKLNRIIRQREKLYGKFKVFTNFPEQKEISIKYFAYSRLTRNVSMRNEYK